MIVLEGMHSRDRMYSEEQLLMGIYAAKGWTKSKVIFACIFLPQLAVIMCIVSIFVPVWHIYSCKRSTYSYTFRCMLKMCSNYFNFNRNQFFCMKDFAISIHTLCSFAMPKLINFGICVKACWFCTLFAQI